VVLEDLEQAVRVVRVVAHQALDEVACDERALTGLGVHAHQRVLRLDQARAEHLAVVLGTGVIGLHAGGGVVVVIAVHGP
jgi:hypothetical protein